MSRRLGSAALGALAVLLVAAPSAAALTAHTPVASPFSFGGATPDPATHGPSYRISVSANFEQRRSSWGGFITVTEVPGTPQSVRFSGSDLDGVSSATVDRTGLAFVFGWDRTYHIEANWQAWGFSDGTESGSSPVAILQTPKQPCTAEGKGLTRDGRRVPEGQQLDTSGRTVYGTGSGGTKVDIFAAGPGIDDRAELTLEEVKSILKVGREERRLARKHRRPRFSFESPTQHCLKGKPPKVRVRQGAADIRLEGVTIVGTDETTIVVGRARGSATTAASRSALRIIRDPRRRTTDVCSRRGTLKVSGTGRASRRSVTLKRGYCAAVKAGRAPRRFR